MKKKTFLIGYDLKAGQDYESLIDAIKTAGIWWRCLDSTWLIKSSLSAGRIRDQLLDHIKADDRLLVALMAPVPDAAWYGFDKECSDWLLTEL